MSKNKQLNVINPVSDDRSFSKKSISGFAAFLLQSYSDEVRKEVGNDEKFKNK